MALVRTFDGLHNGLFAVRLDGSVPVDLGAGLLGGAYLPEFAISADGNWASIVIPGNPAGLSLYRAPTDGSSAPEQVSGAGLYRTGTVLSSPDGTTLSFLQGDDLYRTVFTVGAPATLVHSFIRRSAFDAPVYHFDPDGTDLVVLDEGDVYLYPASGGVRPLNSAHPGVVELLQLEPKGARALYSTPVDDQGFEFTFDLWSVPLDGSTPAVRVNAGAAGPARRIDGTSHVQATLATSPDGHRVVFASAGRLMVGRIDGSQAPAVLVDDASRFLVPLPDSDFTADSETFLYRSAGLFGVSLTGSRTPRQFDEPGSPVGEAEWFVRLGERRGVLFLTEPREDGKYELFVGVLGRAVRGAPR